MPGEAVVEEFVHQQSTTSANRCLTFGNRKRAQPHFKMEAAVLSGFFGAKQTACFVTCPTHPGIGWAKCSTVTGLYTSTDTGLVKHRKREI